MHKRISRFAHLFPPPSEETMEKLGDFDSPVQRDDKDATEARPTDQADAEYIDHVCGLLVSDLAT